MKKEVCKGIILHGNTRLSILSLLYKRIIGGNLRQCPKSSYTLFMIKTPT